MVVKNENNYGDFVCFQITSNEMQDDIVKIENKDLVSGELKLTSFVKYDKCFTINSAIVEKEYQPYRILSCKKSKTFFVKIYNMGR